MDYIDRYDIELEKERYRSGEALRGSVLIDVNENVKVASIQVFLKGKSHVEWKITRAGERRTVKDDQTFIDEVTEVWGKGNGEEAQYVMKKGSHRLDFEFLLPDDNLPPSFESRVGTIRYFLRVIIDIPYSSPPQGLKYFTLVGPNIDCLDEKYTTPRYGSKQISTKCLCCVAGSIGLDVCLDRMAYCCGESLTLRCDVQNGGDREVAISLQLYQIVVYRICKGESVLNKEVVHQVVQYTGTPVRARSTRSVSDLEDDLRLPVMPPTITDACKLVHIRYSLKIGLLLEKCAEDISLEFPIVVTVQPVRSITQNTSNLIYEPANDRVEGGIYISPEFQLGQVYDGNTDAVEDVVLYRPVYARYVRPNSPTAHHQQHQQQPQQQPQQQHQQQHQQQLCKSTSDKNPLLLNCAPE